MTNHRIRILLLGAPAALMAASAVAVAHGAAPAASAAHAKPAKVGLRKTGLGKIVVDRSGSTLYLFTHDRRNQDTCVKISMCAGTWPVLRTRGKPAAGKGVKSARLGTITLAHGVKQVTYYGHPLYTYSFSSGPGDTSYAGTPQFGGTWEAVNAKGKPVK